MHPLQRHLHLIRACAVWGAKSMRTIRTRRRIAQDGMMLIESMVSILLLAVGILGLLAMAARATATLADSEYRTLASERASEMMQSIWVGVNRTDAATIQASLQSFVHRPDESSMCNFSGAAASSPEVAIWASKVVDGAVKPGGVADPLTRLPGSTSAMQQIAYSPADNNRVTITLCWQGPHDIVPRRQVLSSYVN